MSAGTPAAPLDRRALLGAGAAGIAALVVGGGSAQAAPTAADADALSFVTESMTTADVAAIVGGDSATDRATYLALVAQLAPNLAPREQLRMVLLSAGANSHGTQARALALPLVIGIAARALVAAAKRFGPAIYRGLVSAVKRGYAAFNQWCKDHPFAAAFLGAGAYEIFQWLRDNIL